MNKNLRNIIENIQSKDSSSNTPNESKSKNPKQIQKQRSMNYSIIKPSRQGDSFSEHGSATRNNPRSVLTKIQQSPIESQNSQQNGQKAKNMISPAKSKSIVTPGISSSGLKPNALQISKNQSQQSQSFNGNNKYLIRNQSGPVKNYQQNMKNLHLRHPEKSQSSLAGFSIDKNGYDRNDKKNPNIKQAASPNLRQTHLTYGKKDKDVQKKDMQNQDDAIFKDWVLRNKSSSKHNEAAPSNTSPKLSQPASKPKQAEQKKLEFTQNKQAQRSQSPKQEEKHFSKGSNLTRSIQSVNNNVGTPFNESQKYDDKDRHKPINGQGNEKQMIQRSSGKLTLKEQIMRQTSESQKSLIDFMNSDILKATVDPQVDLNKFNLSNDLKPKESKIEIQKKESIIQQSPKELISYQNQNNNYNFNNKQNGVHIPTTQEELTPPIPEHIEEDQPMAAQDNLEPEPQPVDTHMEIQPQVSQDMNNGKLEKIIEDKLSQHSVDPDHLPFYVIEQQESLKEKQLKKRVIIHQQQQNNAQVLGIQKVPFNLKAHCIQNQWKVLSRFILVSKVVLNQMEKFLEMFRDAFIQSITSYKDCRLAVHLDMYFDKMKSQKNFENDAVLTQQILDLANETKAIFLEVYKQFLKGLVPGSDDTKLNLTSMKHCIKRIFKASQIQLDDFQWKNGPYRESQFTTAYQPFDEESVDDELILNTVKQRTKLLTDVIEIEQVSKLYLDLFKKNFYQIYEQSLHSILNLVIFNNDHIQKQTSCFTSKDEQFDFYNRVRAYFQRFNTFQNFNVNLPQNSTSVSVIHQFFTSEDLQAVTQENLLMVSLLELGNTIDGVAIAAKILKDLEDGESEDAKKNNIYVNFQTFNQSFKKRKCHCCMEYILDAGKAVTCANLIKSYNPCLNLYCQNCIVSFMEEKHNYEEDDIIRQKKESSVEQTPQPETVPQKEEDIAEKKKQKEKEEKITKHKLWLKACENILFVCPCCQGYCLNEKLTDMKKEFSQFSVCNFNYKLENHPRSFLRRDVYWYKVQGINKMFYLAKIVGLNKQKQMHKIEVIQNSQTYQVKLSREEIFFTQTVKKGTRLFEIIDKQGPELDIQAQINKQIKDFKKFETQDIFDRFINHVDKFDRDKSKFAIQDGFIIPKFQYINAAQTSRGEFLQCHRQLHRRYDVQIFEVFPNFMVENLCCQDVDPNLIEIPLKMQIKGKQEESQKIDQEMNQEMTPEEESEVVVVEKKNSPKKAIQAPSPKLKPESIPVSKSESQLTLSKTEVKKPISNPESQPISELSQGQQDKKQPKASSQDDKLLIKIGKTCVLVDRNDKEKIESLKRQARHPDKEPPVSRDQSLESRKKPTINYKLFNEVGRQLSVSPKNEEHVQSQIKFVPPADIGIGQQMILEKNYQLAKDQGGEQFSLLITKEVFNVEKVDKQSIDTSIMIDALQLGIAESERLARMQDSQDQMSEDKEVMPLPPTPPHVPEEPVLRYIEFKATSECSMPYIQSGEISPDQNWVANILPYHEIEKKLKEIYEEYEKTNKKKTDEKPKKQVEESLKYSFKDYEPKQYNLRRGHTDTRVPIPGCKKLIFQPSLKKHVEEGFFDDWPEEIVKELKLKVTKKPRAATSKEVSEPAEEQKKPPEVEIKLFKRKFILTPKLQEDCNHSKKAMEYQPEEMMELFIYIYREETKIWRRAQIKTHSENQVFNVEYQDSKKSVRKVDLSKVLFFIDQENDVKTDSQKAMDKIMNYPLFNNKNRVKKLLSSVQNIKEEPLVIKRQKLEENFTIKPPEKILEFLLPPAFLEPSKLLLAEHDQSEVFLEPEQIEPKHEEHSEAKQPVGDPKEEWIRDMKLYIICKSKEQIKNHKVLKFYHQQIDEVDETLSCDFEQPLDDQRVKISQLIEQIKSQAYYEPYNQNFLLNKLEYENQMIQQEKFDYLKKIEQSVEPKFFQQQAQYDEMQMRQIKFLQYIQRINQLKQMQMQQQQQREQLLQQIQPPPVQNEIQFNITQEDNFVEILGSFVKFKALEESHVSDANPKIENMQELIDQLDAVKDLWPNIEQNMPEELEISKVFENLEQAVECLDEAYKGEKQLENELIEFMQIYRKPEESSHSEAHIVSNESTKFPQNIQQEQPPQMLNIPEESPQNQQKDEEINPYQYMKNINQKPLENNKMPNIIDQISNLFNIKNSFIKAKRLQFFLHKFYSDQIILHGYKKCICDCCRQMEYPMLIRFDADSSRYSMQHQIQMQQISQADECFLRTVFSQPKCNKTIKEEQMLRKMGNKPNNVIFEKLIQREQEKFPERNNKMLPKLSQVFTVDEMQPQKTKLEAKIDNMLKEESYDSQKFARDTQGLQVEFSQLREIQKLLNEMKIQKIEKHRKNKQKYLLKHQQNYQKEQMLKNQSFLNQVFEEIFTDQQQFEQQPYWQPPQENYYEQVPLQYGPIQQSNQKLKTEESMKSELMTLLHNPVISKMHVLDNK